MRTGVRGPWASNGTARTGLPGPVSWLFLVVLAALLAVPVFAHGCHGDDIDQEPATAPPGRHVERK